MHPELLNNSLFLRYYNQWLKKPDSVVFASVADYFLIYGKIDDAIKVCHEGLKYVPDCVSGRLVLAKAYLSLGNLDAAEKELRRVLDIVPAHTRALELVTEIELAKSGEAPPPRAVAVSEELTAIEVEEEDEEEDEESEAIGVDEPEIAEVEQDGDTKLNSSGELSIMSPDLAALPAWQTVTMARIYMAQGHERKAKEIYKAILQRDPTNEAAQSELDSLAGGSWSAT